ncbi:MAG TPA: hypothetical protein DCM08_07935 [Microscillaceae bacterium]|jgi:uncharacterized protein YjbI with pentapeptide repeats|nr:hypothetical protein [Microscillaceae bacterium]
MSFDETRAAMIQLVKNASEISADEFWDKHAQHQQFLLQGGAGGRWNTYYIKDLIFGVYDLNLDKAIAELQLQLSFKDLRQLDLRRISMMYANCSGVLASGQNFSEANLEGSLFTDSMLNQVIFRKANLQGADFSRSEMSGCDLREACLWHTDFENCDLTGTDLRGAQMNEHTSFKNAILADVIQ